MKPETMYPERQWFKRNLDMLKRAERPRDYLDGVERARGKEAAEKLAKAAGFRDRFERYQFGAMRIGEPCYMRRENVNSLKAAASQYGQRHGIKFSTRMLRDAVMLIRTS